MIKAVAFDVDGTLYPQWKINITTAPMYLRHYRLANAYWQVRRLIRKENVKKIEDLHRYQAELMAEKLNWDVKYVYEQVEKMVYGDWQILFSRIQLFPHLLKTLQYLKDNGYILAVLSDFPVQEKLKNLGLEGWWHTAISSEDFQTLKPNKIIFENLLKSINLPAHQVLYVGNHYRYDIEGGRGAGMLTAHITARARPHSLANFSFSNYRQFLDKFHCLVKEQKNLSDANS